MSFKTTCHWLVCSSLHESLMNATIIIVEYRYNYYYISSLVYFIFYFFFFYIFSITWYYLLHRKCNCKAGTCVLLLSKRRNIYITCHCRLCFEKFNWLPICEMWSFILFTIWWQFGRCLHFFLNNYHEISLH